jgi:hypothetical protein
MAIMNINSTKTFAVISKSIALLAITIASPIVIFFGMSILETRASLGIDITLEPLLIFVATSWGFALRLLFPVSLSTVSSWFDSSANLRNRQASSSDLQKVATLLLALLLLMFLSYSIIPITEKNIAESLERLSRLALQN